MVRMDLDANRREPVPGDDTTAHWKADWPKVLRVTTDALTGTGKDIHAAARLTEAATKIHGAAGLRDGLRLLQRMVAECWDRMHPVPADGDTTDIRESPVIWLNDVGRGARFPQTVASLPLFRVPGASFSPLDLANKERRAALDEAVASAKPSVLESLRTTHADAPAGTREGLYRQLEQIAAALRRVEPHSPVPFILERCVRLGALPFPDLMRAMIQENAALDALDRLLGIEKKE